MTLLLFFSAAWGVPRANKVMASYAASDIVEAVSPWFAVFWVGLAVAVTALTYWWAASA